MQVQFSFLAKGLSEL